MHQFQIGSGEKFAIIALPELWVDAQVPQALEVVPGLWATREPPFKVDEFWRRTVGSLTSERLEESALFFVATPSSLPDVADAESAVLGQRVWLLYWGLMLTGFMRCGTPYRLTGTGRTEHIDVRSVAEIETPGFTLGTPIQHVDEVRIRLACRVAEALETLLALPRKHRLSRVLHAFYAGINDTDASERLHQFARCIEGFILPDAGSTAKQFKHRTELFVGSRHHADMGEIYAIRSAVEHLHSPYTPIERPTDRERHMALLRRSVETEEVARFCIQRFLLTRELWKHFDNDAAATAFWKLSSADRQILWGASLDYGAVTQSFDSRFITDEQLGLSAVSE